MLIKRSERPKRACKKCGAEYVPDEADKQWCHTCRKASAYPPNRRLSPRAELNRDFFAIVGPLITAWDDSGDCHPSTFWTGQNERLANNSPEKARERYEEWRRARADKNNADKGT